MKKEFIPYEQALALKELGFDEPCFSYYKNDQLSEILEEVINSEMRNVNNEIDDYISAPTFSQCFRWFREKYALYGTIRYGNNEFDKSIYLFPCVNGVIVGNDSFKTQEEAELECLKKLIEITNEKI